MMSAPLVGPSTWHRASLASVGTVVTGTTPSTKDRSNYGRDYMFAGPSDLGKSKYVTRTAKMLSRQGFARSRRIPAGSTLFVCIGSTIGKVGIAGADLVTNQQINSIIPGEQVDPEYLYYATTTMSAIVKGQAGEQAVPLVNKGDFSHFEIMLAPLDEQKAIASTLADADHLVSHLEHLIAKKQAIKQGMMQQLLTGRTRLPGFTGPWAETRLGDLGRCIRGVAYEPSKDLAPGDRADTVRLLRSNNVQGGSIDRDGLQFVHKRRVAPAQVLDSGDIVICMANGSRALVGKAALFEARTGEPRYTFGAFMGGFRTERSLASPGFVVEVLRTHAFRCWLDVILSGSSINNLRPRDVEGFTAPMPDLPEQSAIAAVLAEADQEIHRLRDCLDKTRAVKSGMMQQLLTGRTRLSVGAAA